MSENKHICLALGGARSGKSDFAESTALSLAKDHGQSAVYIATGQAFDDEMKARIKRHLDRRDPQFTTIEEPVDLVSVLKSHDHRHVLLIDSIGVWITNLMINDLDVDKVMADTIEAIKSPHVLSYWYRMKLAWGLCLKTPCPACFVIISG